MPKLNKKDLEDVLDWLRQHGVDCNNRNRMLHRLFSNGVAMATLMKQLYPQLIDLHNYPAQNSTRLKLINWETLNAKVFTKIELPQKQSTLENIAAGNEGAIENLLFGIMTIERENQLRKECERAHNQDSILSDENQVVQIMVNKLMGDALLQVPQKMVLYSLYQKVLNDIEAKNEKLHSLGSRLFQVENDVEQQKRRYDNLIRREEIWANKKSAGATPLKSCVEFRSDFKTTEKNNQRKDLKSTKLPVKHVQILRSLHDKSARFESPRMQTEHSVDKINVRVSKSDLFPRSSVEQLDFSATASNYQNGQTSDANSVLQKDALAAFRAGSFKKLLNSVRTFSKTEDCHISADNLFNYKYQPPKAENYELANLLVESIKSNTEFKGSSDMKPSKPEKTATKKLLEDLLELSRVVPSNSKTDLTNDNLNSGRINASIKFKSFKDFGEKSATRKLTTLDNESK